MIGKKPAAYDDLEAISGYIARDNPDAAHRFLLAAERAFAALASNPSLGQAYPHPRYTELRIWPMGRRFRNYVIFYRPMDEGVEIIRVLHGARNLPEVLNE